MSCLRCGKPLDGAPTNNEHVLGRWLARRTDNTQMIIRDSRRQYGKLQIPVHTACNSEMRRLETVMTAAFDAQTTEALLAVPAADLGAWACKAMYGLVVISGSPEGVTANSTDEEAGDFVFIRDLLIKLRSMFRGFFDGDVPTDAIAVRAYRTLWDRQARDFTFWLTDENAGTLFVQLDSVAVFVSVFDSNYIDAHDDRYTRAADALELNPLQIYEIYCRHLAFLEARSTVRLTRPVPEGDTFDLVCEGVSTPAPPDPFYYRYLLWKKLSVGGGFSEDQFVPDTWLLDAIGRPRHLPLEATRRARSRRLRRQR